MSETWRDALPEPLRESPYIAKAETAEEAAQQLSDAAAWQGNSLRVPSPDSDDEAKATFLSKAVERIPGLMKVPEGDDLVEFYSKIGVPEEAEKYGIPEIENIKFSDEEVGALKAFAKANNLTQPQLDALVNLNAGKLIEAQEAQQALLAQEKVILTEEWGTALDSRVQGILAYLRSEKSAPEGMIKAFEDGHYTAADARFLFTVTEAMREGNEIAQQAQEPVAGVSPAEAKARMDELTGLMIGMPQTDSRYAVYNQERMDMAKVVSESQDALDAARLEKFSGVG
jgi:hypothetical protein